MRLLIKFVVCWFVVYVYVIMLVMSVGVYRFFDIVFYDVFCFVIYIDDFVIWVFMRYYLIVFLLFNIFGIVIFDMCSSWISYYFKGYKQECIVGLGFNEEEFKCNEVLMEYVV